MFARHHRTSSRHPGRFIAAMILVGLALMLAPPGSVLAAATIAVTSIAEGAGGVGDCTLSEAIEAANSASAVDGCDGSGTSAHTITLTNVTYTVTTVTGDTTAGPSAYPAITSDITIDGNGATLRHSGTNPLRLFFIGETGSLTLRDLTVTGGRMAGGPGSSGPVGGMGAVGMGGAAFVEGGALTLERVTMTDNQSVGGAGGDGITPLSAGAHNADLAKFSGGGGGAGLGGAIFNRGGTLTITNSTLYGNSARGGDGGAPGNIFSLPGDGGPAAGGAIYTFGGTVTLSHVTISGSTLAAGAGGSSKTAGGALYVDSASATLTNSILANSEGGDTDCGAQSATVDASSAVIETGIGCGRPLIASDPALGGLSNNGGLTQTMAIEAGSPAFGAAPGCGAGEDQRGALRPRGLACDLGAYEQVVWTPRKPASSLTISDPALTKNGSPGSAIIGDTVVWTVVVHNEGETASNPVTVTDSVPPQFDILGATSSMGATSVSGNTVRAEIPVLPPGGSVTIAIATVANASAERGSFCNIATDSTGGTVQGCMTFLPAQLPSTGGASPLMAALASALPLLLAGVGIGMLGGLAGWRLARNHG